MNYDKDIIITEACDPTPWTYYYISAYPSTPRLDKTAWSYERMLEIVEELHDKGYKVQVREVTEREVYKD